MVAVAREIALPAAGIRPALAGGRPSPPPPPVLRAAAAAAVRRRQPRSVTLAAANSGDDTETAAPVAKAPAEAAAKRDDDVLPDSLTDALEEAARATRDAFDAGLERCVVEILLPEFFDPLSGPVFAEEGDQQRFWKLTRRFLDNLVAGLPAGAAVRAVYPDVGVAAMLRNQWGGEVPFRFSSLNDRRPAAAEDEVVVVASADPQGLEAVVKLSAALEPGQRLVLFNPRLASGDVGVGLSVRRMRQQFLSQFSVVYSLCPVGDLGSVFRRFPSLWQVFVTDAAAPGRFRLAAELPSRPGGEELDLILIQALGLQGAGGQGGGADAPGADGGVLDRLSVTAAGLARFMRGLAR